MKRARRGYVLVVAVSLVVAACTSQSDDATAPDATTSSTVAATTTTQAVTTTQATTTTQPSATADPDGLLDAVNTAMRAQESFLGEGSLSMMDADDGATVHVTANLRGGQSSVDNNWIASILDIKSGDFAGSLQWEIREIDGVQYEQNPVTGAWEIDETRTANPVNDILHGRLVLASTSAEEVPNGYMITGTYPEDETIEFVSIEVDTDDMLVRTFTSVARDVRSEFEGLVPPGETDIIAITMWNFGDYGIEITAAAAPPEAEPTAITRFEAGTFELQIPTAWARVSAEEIADQELDVDAAWSPDDSLLLLVATDDLIELGIGTSTTEDYINILLADVLSGENIEQSFQAVNRQGIEIGFIAGTSVPGDNPFVRLVVVLDGTIAFNATVVGLRDAFEENATTIDFIINSVLINT